MLHNTHQELRITHRFRRPAFFDSMAATIEQFGRRCDNHLGIPNPVGQPALSLTEYMAEYAGKRLGVCLVDG